MKILFLSHRLPYPLIDGGKIDAYSILRQFSLQGHEVHLVCIAGIEENKINLQPLQNITKSIKIFFRNTPNTSFGLLKNTVFSRLPYTITKYMFSDVAEYLNQIIKKIDLLFCNQLHCTTYLEKIRLKTPEIPIVIRQQNVEHVILKRFSEGQKNPVKKALLLIQTKRLKRFECAALAFTDHIFQISDVDCQLMCQLLPSLRQKSSVLSAGIDTKEAKFLKCKHGKTILHVAAMDWLPNQEGLKWFIEKVFPLILRDDPTIILRIGGKNMTETFQKYANNNIQVLGFIPDLNSIIEDSCVGIVPITSGSGMRIKILNYLATGLPVVSTGVGAEGINVTHGKNIMIANNASSFASGVINLLNDKNMWQTLRNNGRALVDEQYDWHSLVTQALKTMQKLSKRK